jgi:two-component system, NarL family, response regulator
MDLRLRGESGARLTTAIRTEFPQARVRMISNYDGDEDIHQALSAGAMGYLFKSIVEDELIEAIRVINAGRRYLPKGVAARLNENQSRVHLTRRETTFSICWARDSAIANSARCLACRNTRSRLI